MYTSPALTLAVAAGRDVHSITAMSAIVHTQSVSQSVSQSDTHTQLEVRVQTCSHKSIELLLPFMIQKQTKKHGKNYPGGKCST